MRYGGRPFTDRFGKNGLRLCPIVPELRPLLEAAPDTSRRMGRSIVSADTEGTPQTYEPNWGGSSDASVLFRGPSCSSTSEPVRGRTCRNSTQVMFVIHGSDIPRALPSDTTYKPRKRIGTARQRRVLDLVVTPVVTRVVTSLQIPRHPEEPLTQKSLRNRHRRVSDSQGFAGQCPRKDSNLGPGD